MLRATPPAQGGQPRQEKSDVTATIMREQARRNPNREPLVRASNTVGPDVAIPANAISVNGKSVVSIP